MLHGQEIVAAHGADEQDGFPIRIAVVADVVVDEIEEFLRVQADGRQEGAFSLVEMVARVDLPGPVTFETLDEQLLEFVVPAVVAVKPVLRGHDG